MADSERYNFADRQREKQASRDQDAADLASGKKTREQLWRENSLFRFSNVEIDFGSVGSVRGIK